MSNGRYITALNNHFQPNEAHLLAWKYSSEGPANALMWTAVCKVRGEVLGSGTASQLRVAKEQAAQSACQTIVRKDEPRSFHIRKHYIFLVVDKRNRRHNLMSRRPIPYLFAGILGVVSGVYIFNPLFENNAAAKELRGATATVKFPDRPQSTTPKESK